MEDEPGAWLEPPVGGADEEPEGGAEDEAAGAEEETPGADEEAGMLEEGAGVEEEGAAEELEETDPPRYQLAASSPMHSPTGTAGNC